MKKNSWLRLAENKITSEDLPPPEINPFDAQDSNSYFSPKEFYNNKSNPVEMPETETSGGFEEPLLKEQLLNSMLNKKKKGLEKKYRLWDQINTDLLLKELDKEIK